MLPVMVYLQNRPKWMAVYIVAVKSGERKKGRVKGKSGNEMAVK